jgi:hypothetical protein
MARMVLTQQATVAKVEQAEAVAAQVRSGTLMSSLLQTTQ